MGDDKHTGIFHFKRPHFYVTDLTQLRVDICPPGDLGQTLIKSDDVELICHLPIQDDLRGPCIQQKIDFDFNAVVVKRYRNQYPITFQYGMWGLSCGVIGREAWKLECREAAGGFSLPASRLPSPKPAKPLTNSRPVLDRIRIIGQHIILFRDNFIYPVGFNHQMS